MAGKTPRIIIADALEDLNPESLEKLRVRLRERRGDGPVLRRAQVDGKTPLQLSDLLVEAFCAGRAVEVTLELLRAVGCNAVAEELDEEAKALTNSAPERPPEVSEEHFVDKHRKELTDRVCNMNPILDLLLQDKVLGEEQYAEVRGIRTTQEQMRFLYTGPLKSGGECSKDRLLSALEEEEKYLMDDLKKKEKV